MYPLSRNQSRRNLSRRQNRSGGNRTQTVTAFSYCPSRVRRGSAQPESIQAEPVPPPKPEWGEQDANGYSVLILPEQGEAGRAGVSMRGVVRGNGVNLRAEPNTGSERLGQFNSGKEFDVTRRYWSGSEENFWYEVGSGDDNGWMYGQFLRVEEE